MEEEKAAEKAAAAGAQDPTLKRKSVTFKLDNSTTRKYVKLRKALYWICGVEKYLNMERKWEVEQHHPKIDTSIDQSKLASIVCNVNAVIAMAICGFVYAFFNKF